MSCWSKCRIERINSEDKDLTYQEDRRDVVDQEKIRQRRDNEDRWCRELRMMKNVWFEESRVKKIWRIGVMEIEGSRDHRHTFQEWKKKSHIDYRSLIILGWRIWTNTLKPWITTLLLFKSWISFFTVDWRILNLYLLVGTIDLRDEESKSLR